MTLPLNTHTNEYVFGRGKIYFDLFDGSGNLQGERFLGNCPGFTLSVSTDTFEHFSSTSGLKKKDLSVVTQITFNGKISCDDVSTANLALFLGGEVSTVTQAAVAVTNEPHTVKYGYEYQLGATAGNPMGVQDVSSVAVKDVTHATTYVLNTDYTLDAAHARISPIKGGAITDGQIVHVTYTPAAGHITRVSTSDDSSLYGAIRFIADNAVGENRDCYIASASLSASGDLSLITDNDIAKFELAIGVNEKDSSTPQIIIDGKRV